MSAELILQSLSLVPLIKQADDQEEAWRQAVVFSEQATELIESLIERVSVLEGENRGLKERHSVHVEMLRKKVMQLESNLKL